MNGYPPQYDPTVLDQLTHPLAPDGFPSRPTVGPQSSFGFPDPLRSTPAVKLLRSAALWLDARYSVSGEQFAVNQGTGGPALNARYGSTLGADSNDPLLLTRPVDGGNYVSLPGTAGNYLSVPDAAALDLTGDIELVCRVSMADWSPSTTQTMIGKWTTAGGQRSYMLGITTLSLSLFVSSDGNNNGATEQCAVTFSSPLDGQDLWVKATKNVTTGLCSFYHAADRSDEPSAWTTIGTNVMTYAGAAFVGTGPVEIGSVAAGATFNLNGTVRRAIIRNGIDGATVLDINAATDITDSAATSFTATSGQTVTVNRSTSGRKLALVTRPVWLFGTDDFLDVANHPLLNLTNKQAATIVLVARVFGTTNLYPLSKGVVDGATSAASAGYAMRTVAGAHYAQAQSDAATGVRPNSSVATTSGTLTTRIITFDGQGRMTARNGATAAAASTALDGTTMANASPLRVGGSYSFADMECLGVALFRRALNTAELATIRSYYGTA